MMPNSADREAQISMCDDPGPVADSLALAAADEDR